MNDPIFNVAGRTAVVTGASSGLGRRFVRCLAERGCKVVAVARRTSALQDLASSYGDVVLPVTADVTDEAAVKQLVAKVVTWSGVVDILVNNAGTTSVWPAELESVGGFRSVVDLNLTALYSCCHHFGRIMLDQKSGVIINVASINGLVASWTIPEASYCASKGGVISLTRELAAQWADRGIRVNALAPGYFPSEMTGAMFATEAGSRHLRRMPMKRGGQEHELDGPLIFLASAASSYMTGQTIVVDGGWTIV